MSWPTSRGRIAVVAAAAVVISLAGFAVVAVIENGHVGQIRAFDACVTQSRFLVLSRHEPVSSLDDNPRSFGEIIRDRARHAVVGEVTTDRSDFILGGAVAANGRYVMSTATPLGRDATAITGCWDRFFPLA